jgi:cellulose biosynthesis protein BcsQ
MSRLRKVLRACVALVSPRTSGRHAAELAIAPIVDPTIEIQAPAPIASFSSTPGMRVVSVVNSKGGVGKTTLANNLAVYLRTVDSSVPVLVIGLDDQTGTDDMFALDDAANADTTFTALQRGTFETAIRLGRYGVYYVPSSPRTVELGRQKLEPALLANALRRAAFQGIVILDTPSDFGRLTHSAVVASDLCIVPVADQASLDSAKGVFDLLASLRRPRSHARVVLSMLDLRIKYKAAVCEDVLGLLFAAARQLDYPLFQSFIARSPRVQALATNPHGTTLSILNEADRTNVHHQMGELADELLEALDGSSAGDFTTQESEEIEPLSEVFEGPLAWLRPRTSEAAAALAKDGRQIQCVRDFPFFIGRQDPGVLNDLVVPDSKPWQVSRRHAHLIRREDRIGVMDLGSTLGTWVNGRQLGGPTLDPGPVFFGPNGGELILGKRESPYVFDVVVSKSAVEPVEEETVPVTSVRAAGLAALVH